MNGSRAVIDASLALKLVLPDPLREPCRTLVGRLMEAGCELLAPTLWAYETTSTLCRAALIGLLTEDEARRALEQLARLGVRLVAPDDAQNQRAFEWTLRLKRGAAYDSYYLALAEALECDLWTTDGRLARAVGEPWVRCIDS